MDKTLLWTALVLGGLGSLVSLAPAFVAGKTKSVSLPLLGWLTAAALPIVVLLGSMPSHTPFSSGQMWGRGFFLGGFAGLLASAALVQGILGNKPGARFALAGQLFAAIAVSCTALLFLRPDVVDGLTGVAIGWLCEATLIYVLSHSVEAPSTAKSHLRQQLVLGTGYAATLAGTVALGVLRGSPTGEPDRWPALALALSAGTAAIAFLASAPSQVTGSVLFRIPGARFLGSLGARLFRKSDDPQLGIQALTAVIVCVAHAALAYLLSVKVEAAGPAFSVAGAGALAGLLCWWICAERNASTAGQGFPPIAALVLVAGTMLAFGRFTGLGVGLFGLAFWLVAVLAVPQASKYEDDAANADADGETSAPHGLLVNAGIAITVLVLYRLVTSRFGADLRGVGITDQFALFAVIAGAFAPGAISSLVSRRQSENSTSVSGNAFRLGLVGAATLALPGIMLLVWGSKISLALLIGLSLSALAPHGSVALRRLAGLPGLIAVGMALALSQWSHHILMISDLARAEKARIALIGLGILVAAIVLDDIAAWVTSSRKRQEA